MSLSLEIEFNEGVPTTLKAGGAILAHCTNFSTIYSADDFVTMDIRMVCTHENITTILRSSFSEQTVTGIAQRKITL